MKAILIDATNRVVTVIEVGKDNIQDMYKAIDCGLFCSGLRLPNNDCLFVDDEGLLKDKVEHAFAFDNKFFAGNGLIMGGRSNGESAPVKISLEEVQKRVKFAPPGWVLPPEQQKEMCKWTITSWE